MGKGKFWPPPVSTKPLNGFWWNLECITTSRLWPHMQIHVTTWVFSANLLKWLSITYQTFNSSGVLVDTTHTHTHPFNGPLSGTILVSWYQKGKTNLDFTGARDSEWQWHQLGHMQVCTSLQTDTTPAPTTRFLQAGCPSCHPTNSIKALNCVMI